MLLTPQPKTVHYSMLWLVTHPTNSYYFDLHKYAVGSKTQIEYPLGVLTIAALFPFS